MENSELLMVNEIPNMIKDVLNISAQSDNPLKSITPINMLSFYIWAEFIIRSKKSWMKGYCYLFDGRELERRADRDKPRFCQTMRRFAMLLGGFSDHSGSPVMMLLNRFKDTRFVRCIRMGCCKLLCWSKYMGCHSHQGNSVGRCKTRMECLL